MIEAQTMQKHCACESLRSWDLSVYSFQKRWWQWILMAGWPRLHPGEQGMHDIPWFCTSEAVESEINVAQHLAKKLLLNLFKPVEQVLFQTGVWQKRPKQQAVSTGLNHVSLPPVSTQSREKAAAPGPETFMTAHECVRGISAAAERLWVAVEVGLEEWPCLTPSTDSPAVVVGRWRVTNWKLAPITKVPLYQFPGHSGCCPSIQSQ